MKKQKSIINILTSRSFKKNKGRNFVAIFAIILTTMMFTTLFTLSESMSKNITQMYLRQSGTSAHSSTKKITDAQIDQIAAHPDVVNYGKSIVIGIAKNQHLAGRQLEIRYANNQYAKNSFAYPTTGKMPENKNEIALDTLTIQRLGIPFELGQTVTLEWKKDLNSSDITSQSFTLCGWWEGNLSVYASMAWVSEDFALEACDNISTPAEGQICGLRMMDISFSDSKNIDRKTRDILNDCNLDYLDFKTNLTYSKETKESIFIENLPSYIFMILVFLAGYLIIFNVFQISITSDIQFYGQLKTLGTTKKQIRKLIYTHGNILSLIGIPIGLIVGYLLGFALVPALIPSTDVNPTTSANPIIFIGSMLFSYLTVMISCMLPARLAGKVSPIEALRYISTGNIRTRKWKSSKNEAFLPRLAWENLWRNGKRTVLIICSLTLGLVLMSFFYAKNSSFDLEKYLSDLTVSDYQIDDTTNKLVSGYVPASQTINSLLLDEINALGNIESTGRLFSQEVEISISEQTKSNLMNYYDTTRLEEFSSYDPTFAKWKIGFDLAISGQKNFYTIYGADGLILEAIVNERYILDGQFDAIKFSTGNYVLAIGPGIDPGTEIPTYSVGEIIQLADRDFEVMAIVYPLQPLVEGYQPTFDLPLILPANTFNEIWPESNLRKFYFNVDDKQLEDAYTLLLSHQKTTSSGMNIVSRKTMTDQYKSQMRSSAIIGYSISIIIALVGILNFINGMVTAIISRKREFAMIQSIGMTKLQLRHMLIYEGLYYAGITLLVSYLLSALTVGIIVREITSTAFSTFHFTIMPLILCTPVLIIIAILIPYFSFKNLQKQSIVERLRG